MHSSAMFSRISLHLTPYKLLLFSLILSASFVKMGSVALSGCHGKQGDSSIPFSFGIFVLAPVLASTWIVWIHNKKKMVKLREILFEKNGGNLLEKKLKCKRSANALMKIYTAEDMKKATNNYSEKRVMQRCNPGTFYRGTLSENDNTEVVIMEIHRVPEPQIEQFVDQLIFFAEPHRNLVKIMGCCLETCFPLLVYELHGDGNDNLFDCIHDEAMASRFSCKMRVKAAAGAARGLAYLHSQNSRARFVHGNIDSGNILLDDSFDAKVFYAVASSLIPRDISSSEQINCRYKDPDFIRSGRLDKKSDVYSFGVVLAEMLTGGKAALDFMSLVKEGNLPEIFQDLTEEDAHLMKEVAMVAARCLSEKAKERPKMKEVEAKLTTLMTLK